MGPKDLWRHPKQQFDAGMALYKNGKCAVIAPAGMGGQTLSGLELDHKHGAVKVGQTHDVPDKGRRNIIRKVAYNFPVIGSNEVVPSIAQGIAAHDFELWILLLKRIGQGVVHLKHDIAAGLAFHHVPCERATAWPNLKHVLPGVQIEGVHNFSRDIFIVQEILAQAALGRSVSTFEMFRIRHPLGTTNSFAG